MQPRTKIFVFVFLFAITHFDVANAASRVLFINDGDFVSYKENGSINAHVKGQVAKCLIFENNQVGCQIGPFLFVGKR